MTVDVTDKKGNFVPYANVDVDFEVKGDYKLIGVENGDVLDMHLIKCFIEKPSMVKRY